MTAAAIVASIFASAAAASATVVSASASAAAAPAAVASASVTESWGPLVGWLEETSLQAGLLVLLILAVRAVLRDRLAPRWRYALWLVLVVRLALPWAPESGWSVYNLVPATAVHGERARDAGGTPAPQGGDAGGTPAPQWGRPGGSEAQAFVVPALAGNLSTSSPTANGTVERFPAKAGTTNVTAANAGTTDGTVPSTGTARVTAAKAGTTSIVAGWSPGASVRDLPSWLPLVWLAGALALLAVVVAQSAALARAIRRRPALADWATMDLLAECRATMGIRPWLLVYETPHVRTPALFGVWRPRLLLPEGAVAALGPERLRHVFLHELAHLRRRDVAMNWVVTLLQVCHWFNPLLWIAFHRMRADRELACDALVLSRVRPEEVPEYGRTIIYLMEAFSFPNPNRLPGRLSSSASLAGILEDRGEAQRRIGMIARFKQRPRRWSVLAIALLLAFAFVALTNAKKSGPAGGNASSAPGGLYYEAATGQLWDLPSLPDQEPLLLPPGEVYLSGTERRVVHEGDAYLFEYRLRKSDYRPTTATTHVWTATFAAKPSATVPGDLDEVAVYTPLIWSEDGKVASLESRPQDGETSTNPAQPLKHPLVSFLHRVSDPRVREYIRLSVALEHDVEAQTKKGSPTNWATVRDNADAVALQDVARQMADAAPQDSFLRVLYMKALVVRHDAAGLRREIEASRPRLAESRVLGPLLWELTETLRAYDLTEAGRNGYDLLQSLYDSEAAGDTPTRLAKLPEVLRYDDYAQPLPPFESGAGTYLQMQTSAKIFVTAADLSLLGGDRRRALEISVSVYRAGQLMSQNSTLVNHLVGTAIRAIAAVRGLARSVFDGCERPEEVQAAFQRLEWLNERERPKSQEDLVALERLSYWSGVGEADVSADFSDAIVRTTMADVHLQLVRMGASAWYVRLKTGQFPKAAAQFELLPGGTPPRDPFGDGDAPLRFAERPDALVCYSLGPDKEDNGGAITYDPTNGTMSAGDVTLEVPRERKYPFPAGGVKARDRADVLRQFPNGLPIDTFGLSQFNRGKPPLGVTDTSPVYIYSRGPDGESAADDNSQDRRDGKPVLPLVTYDPTNGTSSTGDIWLVVPTPGPGTEAHTAAPDAFDPTKTKVYALTLLFQEEGRKDMAACAPGEKPWWEWSAFADAMKNRDDQAVVDLLRPFVEAHPRNLASLGPYQRLIGACLRMKQPAEADAWARQGAAASQEILLEPTNPPDMLMCLKIDRGFRFYFSPYTDADYAAEKDLNARLLEMPQYAELKDFVWENLCDAEHARGHWTEVLRLCTQMDAWYASLPASEKGRLLHEQWRARALFELGQQKEGIALMESLAKEPRAAIASEALYPEIQKMRSRLEAVAPSGPLPGARPTAAPRRAAAGAGLP